jgi:hypothetical protein
LYASTARLHGFRKVNVRPGKLLTRRKTQGRFAAVTIVKIVPENLIAEWASNGKKTISALNERWGQLRLQQIR